MTHCKYLLKNCQNIPVVWTLVSVEHLDNLRGTSKFPVTYNYVLRALFHELRYGRHKNKKTHRTYWCAIGSGPFHLTFGDRCASSYARLRPMDLFLFRSANHSEIHVYRTYWYKIGSRYTYIFSLFVKVSRGNSVGMFESIFKQCLKMSYVQGPMA